MKVRTDFVSNSSSCSFVICNVPALIDLFKTLFKDIDIPYDFDNDINCRLYVRRKDWEHVYEDINNEKPNFKPTFADTENENDISYWDSIHTNFANIVASPEKLNDVAKIEFDCEDYGSGPIYLQMFYKFLVRAKLNPDASNSEHEFCEKSENDFLTILDTYHADESK